MFTGSKGKNYYERQRHLNLWTSEERRNTGSNEHGFTSPPTQYRLYGRRFLQVKRPNQQYQSTEGTHRIHK